MENNEKNIYIPDYSTIKKPENLLLLNTPGDFYNLNQEQREILVKWIKTNLKPIKSFNREMTNYSLKYFFEKDIEGFYIHNGQFKGTMLECGFKPHRKKELNWFFNISRKSITKLRERKLRAF
jgi:hypothetical protein